MAENNNQNTKFTFNNLVVITSNTSISMYSWRKYLMENWKDIMKEKTRLLILGGIHGNQDGSLGIRDKRLEQDIVNQVKEIRAEKDSEMLERNIDISYKFIEEYLDQDTWKPIADKLVGAVLEYEPTILLLAFCYTSQSIFYDALRSQGIHSILIMQKEREHITKGKCIFLDEEQKNALLKIAELKPKLVMLQGKFGTGKTILLMETLRIKIEQCKEANIRFKIIVTSDTKQMALIEYLKNNYIFEDVDIEFFDCLKDVQINDDLDVLGQVNSIEEFNICVKRLGQSNKDITTILVIDEFFIKGKQDWNKVRLQNNVNVILAFHPRKDPKFDLILPEKKRDMFPCTLKTMYRNSYDVLRLCCFVSSHSSLFTESSTAKIYPLMLPSELKETKSKLPSGATPLWIELEGDDINPITVMKYINLKHLKRARNVTFITDDSHTHSEDVDTWLRANRFDRHTSSEFAHVAFSFEQTMRGLEDEIIVYMPNSLKDYGLLMEVMTRARNAIILATTKTSVFKLLFDSAVNHSAMTTCSLDNAEGSCEFIGLSEELLIKEEVSDQKLLMLELDLFQHDNSSVSEVRLFWLAIEPLIVASEKCCRTFFQNDGLQIITKSIKAYSSCDINPSLIRVLGHLTTIPTLADALERAEIVDYLEELAQSSHQDKQTQVRAGMVFGIISLLKERKHFNKLLLNMHASRRNMIYWLEEKLRDKSGLIKVLQMDDLLYIIGVLSAMPKDNRDAMKTSWIQCLELMNQSQENHSMFVQNSGLVLISKLEYQGLDKELCAIIMKITLLLARDEQTKPSIMSNETIINVLIHHIQAVQATHQDLVDFSNFNAMKTLYFVLKGGKNQWILSDFTHENACQLLSEQLRGKNGIVARTYRRQLTHERAIKDLEDYMETILNSENVHLLYFVLWDLHHHNSQEMLRILVSNGGYRNLISLVTQLKKGANHSFIQNQSLGEEILVMTKQILNNIAWRHIVNDGNIQHVMDLIKYLAQFDPDSLKMVGGITIVSTRGKRFGLVPSKEDKVSDIKVKLSQKCGIKPERQTMYCFGYHVDDNTVPFSQLIEMSKDAHEAFTVVFPLIAWKDGAIDKDLDTDREAFTILQGPFMTLLTGRNKRTVLNLTTKNFVLLFPTKREAPSGKREYKAEFYQVEQKGSIEVILKENEHMEKSLLRSLSNGSEVRLEALKKTTLDETKDQKNQNNFLHYIQKFKEFISHLRSELEKLDSDPTLNNPGASNTVDKKIHLKITTSSNENEVIEVPITYTMNDIVEASKKKFCIADDRISVYWGTLALHALSHDGPVKIESVLQVLSHKQIATPRLFVPLLLAGPQSNAQNSSHQYFLEQKLNGESKLTMMQPGIFQAVVLTGETFSIILVSVVDGLQTNDVKEFSSNVLIGEKVSMSLEVQQADPKEYMLHVKTGQQCQHGSAKKIVLMPQGKENPRNQYLTKSDDAEELSKLLNVEKKVVELAHRLSML